MYEIPDELNQEFEGSTDRAAAIIGGAYVEETLLYALQQHLHREKKPFERLFLHSGPLATFEARINISILVGLINDEFAQDLKILKDIRNRFAHHLDLKSFDTPAITDRLKNLSLITIGRDLYKHAEKTDPSPRQLYQMACGEAGGYLRVRRHTAMPKPPTFR